MPLGSCQSHSSRKSDEPSAKRIRTNSSWQIMETKHAQDGHKLMHYPVQSATTALISPPISPETALQGNVASEQSCGSKDLILYPDHLAPTASQTRLLLPVIGENPEATKESNTVPEMINDKASTRVNNSTQVDENQFGSFRSNISNLYNRSPRNLLSYLKAERAQKYCKRDSRSLGNKSPPLIRTLEKTPQLKPRSTTRNRLVSHKDLHGGRTVSLAHIRKTETMNQSPKAKIPKKRDEDLDFSSLEDFCPPASEMVKPEALLAPRQSSAPLDLSDDPYRHLLDDAEIPLASSLRLHCAKYLCCKRRLFIAFVNCLRSGKTFNKTVAQGACKIDVNKASSMWEAYNNSGWLNPILFRKFL